MVIVLIILIVALIAKDTSYLNDPYLMRGISQGLCLIVGLGWLLNNITYSLLCRYWGIIGYILILLISSIISDEQIYVMLQVVSITSVILFAISLFESRKNRIKDALNPLINTTIFIYTLVMLISLLIIFVAPSLAYQHIHSGNWINEIRFRGLFSQAGMMGGAGGLLIGLSYFGLKNSWLKVIPVISGSVCLALTQSRTFWVAAIIAGCITFWLYYPKKRKITFGLVSIGLVVAVIFYVFDITPDMRKAKKLARTDSITNLTGRTEMWQKCLNAFSNRPFFGYGFTVGSLGLENSEKKFDRNNSSFSPRDIGRRTLHSGYMQSLLDAGVTGTVFYLYVIILSIIRICKYDSDREFPMMFYSLIFLIIANFAEDVIYSASVYTSIFFWIVSVFAVSLRLEGSKKNALNEQVVISST